MRVSAHAHSVSRRTIMHGLAAGLVGATVPAAGLAARTIDADAELLALCKQWKGHRGELRKMEKELTRLTREAEAKEPPTPSALFEKINLCGNLIATPF